MTAILGIDPGKGGALALLFPDDRLEIQDMPCLDIKGKRVLDHYRLARIVDNWSTERPRVWIEQVHAWKGEGAVGAFDFGRTYGMLIGVCASSFLSIEYVAPVKWKRAFNLIAAKDEAILRAKTEFPLQCDMFARKKDDGRAEAALIALFGRRQGEIVERAA